MSATVTTLTDKCQRCDREATMRAENVGTRGTWHYCTQHMREAMQRRHFEYVWPRYGNAAATPAQRALFRDASAPIRRAS